MVCIGFFCFSLLLKYFLCWKFLALFEEKIKGPKILKVLFYTSLCKSKLLYMSQFNSIMVGILLGRNFGSFRDYYFSFLMRKS